MQVLMDTMDVKIFDENGKLVADFDSNQQAVLTLSSEFGQSYFGFSSATVNIPFINNLGVEQEQSDFDKATGKKTTIKFKQNSLHAKEYKIVANGIMYDRELVTKSHNFDLVIHRARLHPEVELFNARCAAPFEPSYIFMVLEDENNEFVDLQLEEIQG